MVIVETLRPERPSSRYSISLSQTWLLHATLTKLAAAGSPGSKELNTAEIFLYDRRLISAIAAEARLKQDAHQTLF
jgi:hypothetical protein